MITAEERIKELARKSAIDPKAAAEMLDAVKPAPVARVPWWDPFTRISGEGGAIAGVGASVAFALMSLVRLRTNGNVDFQISSQPVSTTTAIVDQVLAFPVHALILWLVARPFARNTRFVDVLGAVGLARAAAAICDLPLAGLHLAVREPSGPLFAVAMGFVLAGFGLQIALLVMGYRTATNLRGPKLTLTFLGGFIAAEAVIKTALHLAHR